MAALAARLWCSIGACLRRAPSLGTLSSSCTLPALYLHSTCTLPALYLHSTCTQVQVGASLEARDGQGMTPLDLASDARVRQALLAVTRNTQAEGGKAEL